MQLFFFLFSLYYVIAQFNLRCKPTTIRISDLLQDTLLFFIFETQNIITVRVVDVCGNRAHKNCPR